MYMLNPSFRTVVLNIKTFRTILENEKIQIPNEDYSIVRSKRSALSPNSRQKSQMFREEKVVYKASYKKNRI